MHELRWAKSSRISEPSLVVKAGTQAMLVQSIGAGSLDRFAGRGAKRRGHVLREDVALHAAGPLRMGAADLGPGGGAGMTGGAVLPHEMAVGDNGRGQGVLPLAGAHHLRQPGVGR